MRRTPAAGWRAWLAFGALLHAATPAAAAGPGDAGALLWKEGRTAEGPIVGLAGGRVALRGPQAACGRCHGADAEGGGEGGLRVPALAGRALALRGVATPAALAASLRTGTDASGRALHPAMPCYDLDPALAESLHAFLSGLQHEATPGVTGRSLTLGVVLPGWDSPASPPGRIWTVLAAAADDLARRGGLYGREIRLVGLPADGGDEDLAGLAAALDRAPVLATVASLGVEPGGPVERLLRERGVPCLFPLRGVPATPESCPFRLGAKPELLAGLLAERAAQDLPSGGTIAVAASDGDAARPVAERLPSSVRLARLEPVPTGRPDAVLVLDGTEPLRPLLAALPAGVRLYGPVDRLGPLLLDKSLGTRPLTLADPHPQPGTGGAAAARLRAWLGRDDGEELPALERVAYAGFLLVEEALRRVGRRVTRPALLRELAGLQGFETGLLPPVDFVRHRDGGLGGARFLVTQGDGALAVEPWRELRARP